MLLKVKKIGKKSRKHTCRFKCFWLNYLQDITISWLSSRLSRTKLSIRPSLMLASLAKRTKLWSKFGQTFCFTYFEKTWKGLQIPNVKMSKGIMQWHHTALKSNVERGKQWHQQQFVQKSSNIYWLKEWSHNVRHLLQRLFRNGQSRNDSKVETFEEEKYQNIKDEILQT